jgi:hypothetical protein
MGQDQCGVSGSWALARSVKCQGGVSSALDMHRRGPDRASLLLLPCHSSMSGLDARVGRSLGLLTVHSVLAPSQPLAGTGEGSSPAAAQRGLGDCPVPSVCTTGFTWKGIIAMVWMFPRVPYHLSSKQDVCFKSLFSKVSSNMCGG